MAGLPDNRGCVGGEIKHSVDYSSECFEFFLDANASVERFGKLRGLGRCVRAGLGSQAAQNFSTSQEQYLHAIGGKIIWVGMR